MKYKIFLAVAMVGVMAFGCSKSQVANTPPPDSNQPVASQNAAPAPTPVATQTPTPAASPQPSSPGVFSSGPGAEANPQPEVLAVNITADGFSPSPITIHKGDYIQFTNKDTQTHWPASDPHPAHNGYPSNPPFDPKHALKPGEKWLFQFKISGSWGYHDHLNPITKGRIVVQ